MLSRRPEPSLTGYGNPYGHKGLRDLILLLLRRQGIATQTDNIILTHGASQALELSIRCLTKSGDTVLVEDPGYCNLFPLLRALGLRIIGIPREVDGPNLEELNRAARIHSPRLFIINTRLQNPTGTSCSLSKVHHILNCAERFDFKIIEDDTFGGLSDDNTPTLAQLDQIERVIFVSSFSKTICPSLRVGFVVCSQNISNSILHLKMATSLTSSTISEALVFNILADGRYRHHLSKLREKLLVARSEGITRLEKAGMAVFSQDKDGLFLWARFVGEIDSVDLTRRGLDEGIMLAPGFLFSPEPSRNAWFRFNVSYLNDRKLFDLLLSII
ncbi:GntR family transcriptional regulator [Neokomagataea thailandica NBRC 106555]|nr:GntR family transcriptional regulator [Neokomagataea thailandica NBRC 106555]